MTYTAAPAITLPSVAWARTARTALFSLVNVWARQPRAAGHSGRRMLPEPELHGVDAGQQPVIGEQRRIKLMEVLAEVGLERAIAGDEVDGTVEPGRRCAAGVKQDFGRPCAG